MEKKAGKSSKYREGSTSVDYRGKSGMYSFSQCEVDMVEAAVRCRVETAKENLVYRRKLYGNTAESEPKKDANYKEWQRWSKLYNKHFGAM